MDNLTAVERSILGGMDFVARIAAFALCFYAMYVAGIALLEENLQRSSFFAAGAGIVLLTEPLARRHAAAPGAVRALLWLTDVVLVTAFVLAMARFMTVAEEMSDSIIFFTDHDRWLAVFAGLVAVELTRRRFGIILPTIVVLSVLYMLFGANLPGFLRHSGFPLGETLELIWWRPGEGIFNLPLDVVSRIVLVFLIFGAVLEGTGGGAILLKMATAATARLRGGPAHAAILGSAMFGTINGSPVANVASTGVFTIPLIKKQGFKSSFAGGVEASASSGGQFTPPIMGAVAFILADLAGVPYVTVAIAAIIPALFYYFSLFAAVYTEAARLGIGALPPAERPVLSRWDWLQSLRFFGPLIVIIGILVSGRSAAMAGFVGILVAIPTGLILERGLYRDPGETLRRYGKAIARAFVSGGRQSAAILVIVGAIGIFMSVVNTTGVAFKFAGLIAELGEGSLFLALGLAMISSLILGMGLPTLPAYFLVAIFLAPAVGQLGVEILLAHLFVLLFAILSNVTPPVAIAAYTAAPIADADPLATGFQAVRVAIVGFIIPYVWIYYPSLVLVVDFQWGEFIWIMFRLPIAIWLVATALSGHEFKGLGTPERALRAALALAVLLVDPMIHAPAVVLAVALLGWRFSARPRVSDAAV
ncbi:MAG: TRAP transporter fused permease subunit [Paracoccaceae bacterium]